jgi:hypothetical protein
VVPNLNIAGQVILFRPLHLLVIGESDLSGWTKQGECDEQKIWQVETDSGM